MPSLFFEGYSKDAMKGREEIASGESENRRYATIFNPARCYNRGTVVRFLCVQEIAVSMEMNDAFMSRC